MNHSIMLMTIKMMLYSPSSTTTNPLHYFIYSTYKNSSKPSNSTTNTSEHFSNERAPTLRNRFNKQMPKIKRIFSSKTFKPKALVLP